MLAETVWSSLQHHTSMFAYVCIIASLLRDAKNPAMLLFRMSTEY